MPDAAAVRAPEVTASTARELRDRLDGLVLARGDAAGAAIAQPNFFCFGGCLDTARRLSRVRDGAFELTADGKRFAVGA